MSRPNLKPSELSNKHVLTTQARKEVLEGLAIVLKCSVSEALATALYTLLTELDFSTFPKRTIKKLESLHIKIEKNL